MALQEVIKSVSVKLDGIYPDTRTSLKTFTYTFYPQFCWHYTFFSLVSGVVIFHFTFTVFSSLVWMCLFKCIFNCGNGKLLLMAIWSLSLHLWQEICIKVIPFLGQKIPQGLQHREYSCSNKDYVADKFPSRPSDGNTPIFCL